MSKESPCDTCEFRLGFVERANHPERTRAFIADNISEPIEDIVTQALEDDSKVHQGLEAERPNCPGKKSGMTLGVLADRIAGPLGSTAAERHCSNPYLQSEEYRELRGRFTIGGMEYADMERRSENGLPPREYERHIFRQIKNVWESSFTNKVILTGLGALILTTTLSIFNDVSSPKPKPKTPADPHGLAYMAKELQGMNMGWGHDKIIIGNGNGISGYRVLPDGTQVETDIFSRSDTAGGSKRVNPNKVNSITLQVFAPGVNHLKDPYSSVESYSFFGPPLETPNPDGFDTLPTYAAEVSYASQQKIGIGGIEAFKNDAVATYGNCADCNIAAFETPLHLSGSRSAANTTALEIESQALSIASATSHDHNLPRLRLIQQPKPN